ncbi:hypothetical protein ARMGADRAFT_1038486 [Armillaria gallica]|uniref:Uncharacterized protein n=1 Tax=Armillaria gallica TaxID=47427 RepID=A0A2H3D0P6_ARMGA|nr:hypothetical protein ARMGADRAFT_1038486 [Armillaria gallica]
MNGIINYVDLPHFQGTEREFCQGEPEAWAPTTFKGTLVMEWTNQYLKKLQEDLGDIAIPFPNEADPRGTLKQVTRPNLVHTEEDSVQYIRMLDQWRQEKKVKPQVFRIGNIVEVQITLAVVRGEKNVFRMKPILS